MSAIIEHGSDSFVADSTTGVAANLRVKLTSGGKITPASASEQEIGVTKIKTSDNKEVAEVRLRNAPGSVAVTAGDAVVVGAVVNRAAGGKVTTAGSSAYGIAAEAAAVDGDVITVYPL